LRAAPRVLLVDEPARGIDVGAKAEIFALLQDVSKQGMGVVIVSEETEELAAFADRVLVLCRGAVAGEFDTSKASLDEIGRAMFPVS
jgi:ABC-type sugar transport system ATPase subunit